MAKAILVGNQRGKLVALVGELPQGFLPEHAHIDAVMRHGNQFSFAVKPDKAHQVCCSPRQLCGSLTTNHAPKELSSLRFDVDWGKTDWEAVLHELATRMKLVVRDRDIYVLVTPPTGTCREIL